MGISAARREAGRGVLRPGSRVAEVPRRGRLGRASTGGALQQMRRSCHITVRKRELFLSPGAVRERDALRPTPADARLWRNRYRGVIEHMFRGGKLGRKPLFQCLGRALCAPNQRTRSGNPRCRSAPDRARLAQVRAHSCDGTRSRSRFRSLGSRRPGSRTFRAPAHQPRVTAVAGRRRGHGFAAARLIPNRIQTYQTSRTAA